MKLLKKENIYKFLKSEEPDKYGRMIEDIWNFSKYKLEYTHNYIQRLFPTEQKSCYENAQIINSEDIEILDKKIQNNMKKSFNVMLNFYDFEYKDNVIVPKNDAKFHWVSNKNHNYLRITRILKSLKIFGLEKEANDFYFALIKLSKIKKIDEISIKYWKNVIDS